MRKESWELGPNELAEKPEKELQGQSQVRAYCVNKAGSYLLNRSVCLGNLNILI